MRTTLDLPDATFRRLKTVAAQQGVTLKYLLREAVERELERAGRPRNQQRITFPVLASKQPGSLRLTNAEVEDLLT